MNFLKENTFLVVTAAVVIVAAPVLLLLARSDGGQTDAAGDKLSDVSRDINSLASSGINEKVVDSAGRRVEGMRNLAEAVADDFLERNRRGYEMLTFNFKVAGKSVLVPAFPVDPDAGDRQVLRLRFPEHYQRRVFAMLKTLQPTVPPTEEEIKLEAARIAASMVPVEKTDDVGPTSPTIPPTYTGEFRRPDVRVRGERRIRPPGERGPAAGLAGVQSDVGQQALTNLVMSKSEKGWMYADKDSLHVALQTGSQRYYDDSLWLATVGLWVQQDILEAINLTNRQVHRTASGSRSGVAASAVKQLMGIDVRGYVFLAGGTTGGRVEAGGRNIATTTTLQYGDMGGGKCAKPAPQLTQRGCNMLYDVIHYDFTVVLPMCHLLKLQKNLMAQNYHTVLQVNISRPEQSQMYYYGTDPVVKVTIVGELLMLTDWTRGRWDKGANDWDKDCPPLMPRKTLEHIENNDPSAIRDVDNKRLSPAGGAGTGRGGGERPM